MRYFLICPVRKASIQQQQEILSAIDLIERSGHSVYYPARDTNQVDDTGYQICTDNLAALQSSDEVLVYFDSSSSGTLFDLGMAFALNKTIRVLNAVDMTSGKSFANMILHWTQKGAKA